MPVKEFDNQDGATLYAAQNWVQVNLKAPGVICPCCGQMAAMRKRNFNVTMARVLIMLYLRQKAKGCTWVHVERLLKQKNFPTRGDFYKLKYWGLIVPRPPSQETGNPNTGYYKLTELGKQFALCEVKLPAYAWVFHDKVIAWSDEKISCKKALKKQFNYRDLMGDE